MAVDMLSTVFAALADPTRRAILSRLADGELTVNDLSEPFPISVQAVSKHLKVLESAGLVTRARRAQWRPCQLRAQPLADATEWLERYRGLWGRSFDLLDVHLSGVEDDTDTATHTDTATRTDGTRTDTATDTDKGDDDA